MTQRYWVSLLNAKRQGADGQYIAHCPAHDDQHVSLSIGSDSKGNTLLHCHAGCPTESIVAAVGKAMTDLYDDAQQPKEIHTIKATDVYPYQDITGQLHLEKHRFPGKSFRWYRDGKLGLGGILPALYCAFSTAVKQSQTVFWAEGEKDVNNLTLCAYAAVCLHSGAAGKPTPEQLEVLRGKNIIILPDNDEPGRKHAQNAATALQGIAASVKVIDLTTIDPKLPEKGDISDLIDDHDAGIIETVRDAAERLPEWSGSTAIDSLKITTARDLMVTEFKPLIQAVENFICEGLTFLVAASKVGKSWLALQMALRVAAGEPFLDKKTTKCRVLYFALEDSKRRLQARLKTIGVTSIPDNLYFVTEAQMLDTGFEQQLDNWLSSDASPAMVIVDTFQKVRGLSKNNTNAYQADYEVVGRLKKLADQHRAMLVCIHHTNKMRIVSDPYEKISGSTGIMAAADTTILMERERGTETATVKLEGRDVYGKDIIIRFNNGLWELENSDAAAYNAARDYEAEPLVQLFRQLIAENPKGNRWTYTNLQARGLELLEYQPFIDGKDCANKLNNGLANELRTRDGILVETGVRVENTRGIKLQPVKPLTSFQTKIHTDEKGECA